MHLLRHVALVASLSAAACATTSSSTDRAARGNPSRITAAELEASTQTNVGDYIRAYRPRWFQSATRGPSDFGGTVANVIVYIGTQRAGGVDQLQSIAPSAVSEIRYYEATEAQQRFNIRQASPVIQVILRT